MADLETRVANVRDPEVVGAVAVAELLKKSVLVASGAVSVDGSSPVQGGGQVLTIPRFKLATGSWQSLSDSASMETKRIEALSELGIVVRRGDAFAIRDLAKLVSAEDLNVELGRQIAEVAGYLVDQTLVYVLQGATPSANKVDGSSAVASVAKILETKAKLGDNMEDVALIVMHSKVFSDLEQANAVTYFAATDVFPGSGLSKPVPMINGKPVWITDKAPLVSGSPNTYITYLLGKGAMYLGYQRNMNVEFDRDIKAKMDIVSYDLHFVPHLMGVGWNDAGRNPSDATLRDTTKWALKAENAKLVRAAALTSR